MKTYAPSATKRAAVASPRPLFPPVMTAIFPSSLPMEFSFRWPILFQNRGELGLAGTFRQGHQSPDGEASRRDDHNGQQRGGSPVHGENHPKPRLAGHHPRIGLG